MRTGNMRESQNVEDRRGMRGGGRMVAGGGGVLGVIIVVIYLLMGGNPQNLPIGGGTGSGGPSIQTIPGGGGSATIDPRQQEVADRVRRVLGDTEDVWTEIFASCGMRYQPTTLVLFSGATDTACGFGQSATGPFYCPLDQKVYIDLEFYDELSRRFGAPGDFAQAYVIAHEVGHHVQNLLGVMDKVDSMRGRVSKAQQNDLSVRLELQADYLAGVWAHHANKKRKILEPGDIEEALNAAHKIGDDHLQRQTQGHVVPDSFTHGTSAQRMKWFKLGFESGDLRGGDTFAVDRP